MLSLTCRDTNNPINWTQSIIFAKFLRKGVHADQNWNTVAPLLLFFYSPVIVIRPEIHKAEEGWHINPGWYWFVKAQEKQFML